ncbi:MAG: baseplate J/gp47 family protein [Actinomycetota bacterium]|nr:baseplate J/gp47 family protein [Actinomycetota bacterium]
MTTIETFNYAGGPTTVGSSPVFSTEDGYILLPVTLDPNELIANALATIATNLPGWVPQEGHLEVLLLEVVAQMVAETAQVAANMPLAAFRYYGGLVGVPPEQGAAATVPTTWVMSDNRGYTIPAGTYVAYPSSGNQSLLFTTAAPVVVPPGQTSTAPGAAVLQALSVGAVYNGAAGAFDVYDALAYVAAINSTAPSSGGVDPETDAAYLGRLADTLQTLSPRPILPHDFSALARTVAGVARAVTVDGYNPADGSMGNARMVAVACVDVAGQPLGAPVAAAVTSYLQALREANFVINLVTPTYTPIAVAATLKAARGSSANVVAAAITAAMRSLLSPANWGGGNQTPPTWTNTTTVRYLDIVGVIATVPGVDLTQPSVVTLGGGPSPTLAAADVSLTAGMGVVALPTVGALNISVS